MHAATVAPANNLCLSACNIPQHALQLPSPSPLLRTSSSSHHNATSALPDHLRLSASSVPQHARKLPQHIPAVIASSSSSHAATMPHLIISASAPVASPSMPVSCPSPSSLLRYRQQRPQKHTRPTRSSPPQRLQRPPTFPAATPPHQFCFVPAAATTTSPLLALPYLIVSASAPAASPSMCVSCPSPSCCHY